MLVLRNVEFRRAATGKRADPKSKEAVTNMLKPFTAAAVAASVWAAALALPAQAKDSEAVPAATAAAPAPAASATPAQAAAPSTATASPSAATARAQAAPTVKRVRRAHAYPRRVASAAPHYSQCFLFWCSSRGQPYRFLVLGVAY